MEKTKNNIKESRDKSLAINLLLWFSIGISLIFCFLISMYLLNAGNYYPALIILFTGLVSSLLTVLFVKLKKYTLAKYLIIIVPPYIVLFASLATKSHGVFANVLTYLAPRFLMMVYLMAPVIFFGLRHKKKLILSVVILLPAIIFFDKLHNFVGVYITDLDYIPEFYGMFVMMTSIFLIFPLLSLLLFQRTNGLFRRKIEYQKLEIIKEKIEIESLNEQLQFQSNLYKILDITSKNKKLVFVLQEVLEQILKIGYLDIEHKGVIFLVNAKEVLEIAAQYNADSLLTSCKNVKKGECLCGEVFESKKMLFCNEVEKNHTIHPEGMKPHGHYVIPIKALDEVVGVITIYIKKGENRNKNVELFLKNVAVILSRRIVLDRNAEKLVKGKIEYKEIGDTLQDTLAELNASITYAQFLQKSLIPNKKTINSLFKESSFLFEPKDKISGDFYFAHRVEDKLFFGIGDCTGHGIPGGFLAAMSVESVKTIILSNQNEKPDVLLEKLRKIARERFATNLYEKRTDAMDAAMCLYDKSTEKLYYAGGFINLYIVRNKEILVYTSTKCPVGSYPVEYKFELHEIDLKKDDVIYLSSDGFQDQFGHDVDSSRKKVTKFKGKRFRDLLIEISHLSCDDQVVELKKTLKNWSQGLEQIDDITVFIVKH